ncbi:MAG: EamA family transporter [Candidatus Heimdallarchaeota archaeon]|nr:EamA family transporter [Candidatus Heimdallarchaeota archaeon]
MMIIIAGVLGTYLSSYYLVRSTQELGAGLTGILTATGPLFALPVAFIWLKEKMTWKIIAGSLLTIIGLLVVLSL